MPDRSSTFAAIAASLQLVNTTVTRILARCGTQTGIALLVTAAVAASVCEARADQPLDHFMFYGMRRLRSCAGGPTPGAACTSSDECAGGSCTSSFPTFGPIQLTDQFRTADYNVGLPRMLGLPADKNAEGIHDANTHLRWYSLARPSGTTIFPKTRVRVFNQCTNALVDALTPDVILLPNNESLTGPVPVPDELQHGVDHFLCYHITLPTRLPNGTPLPKFPKGMQVEVADQFQTRRYDLKRITRLCNPVDKHEDPLQPPVIPPGKATGAPKPITPASIRNPSTHLLCYLATLARNYIPQTGCGATEPITSTPIYPRQLRSTKNTVFVNDQFGPARLQTSGTQMELCIPSSKSICGNNVTEAPEACDGTDNAACDGMPCRADCTCTPVTCGDNVQAGAAEACDGTDNAACGGLPCLPDCNCTPPSCGDNIKNQPVEACDGTDDSACPGQCNSHCLCPGPACTQDPTRTLFTGPPGLGCFTFSGDQATCLTAYENDDDSGHLAQCLYGSNTGNCYSCYADSQLNNECTNTCNCGNGVVDTGEQCDGAADTACPGACASDCRCPPPTCTQAPGRTFVGWLENNYECRQITDQAACEGAFYVNGPDPTDKATSCYFSSGACYGCDPGTQEGGGCLNACACGNNVAEPGEECDGTDHSNCGSGCGADCRCLPPSCGDNIVNQDTEQCDGLDNTQCPGQCTSNCLCFQPCQQDPTRTILVGPPGQAGCHQFDADPTSCEHAYNLSGTGGVASCYYVPGECRGCGPTNQSNNQCTNTCLCGNNVTDDGEECDGTDNSACGGVPCQADCRCTPPTCGDNVVNQSSEDCDGTDDSACPAQCQGDCKCPPRCGDDIVNQPTETCDGADNSACGGLPCKSDCTCTAPSCGDNIVNQPTETCDGTDDSACPGNCQNDCHCP